MSVSTPKSLLTPIPPEMREQYLADYKTCNKNRENRLKITRIAIYTLCMLLATGMGVGLLCCTGAIQSIELNVSAWIFTAISLGALFYLEKKYLTYASF